MTDLIITLQNLGHLLLEIMAKGLLVSLFFLWLAHQLQDSSAATRRIIWLCYFGVLALLPALTLLPVAAFEIAVLPPQNPFASANPSLSISHSSLWIAFATGLYLVLVCLSLWKLFSANLALYKITKRARPVNIDADVKIDASATLSVKASGDIHSPCTWGYLKPVVLLPTNCETWSTTTWQMVLTHELNHIRQADWLWMTIARIIGTLFFPVFIVKSAYRALCFEIENSVDDAVLGTKRQCFSYAKTLVDFANAQEHSNTTVCRYRPGLIQRFLIYARVSRLLDPYTPRGAAGRPEIGFACIFILGLIISLGSVKLTHMPWEYDLQIIEASNVNHSTKHMSLGSYDRNNKINTHEFSQHKHKIEPSLEITPSSSERLTLALSELNTTNAKANGHILEEYDFAASMLQPEIQPPNFTQPALIHFDAPAYPRRAKQQQREASVSVKYDVDTKGRATNIRVADDKQSRWFRDSVIRAMETAQFVPAKFDGTPVYTANQRKLFRFSLSGPAKPTAPDTS